jgi:hypothetical protein
MQYCHQDYELRNCVNTVGLDHEMIWKYVKWQEKPEQKQEELRFSK